MPIQLNETLRLDWNWSNFLDNDTAPKLHDVQSNETLCSLVGHSDQIRGVKLIDDSTLFTWSNDRTVRVWNTKGNCLGVLHHDDVVYQAYLIDEETIITLSGKNTFKSWRWLNETCLTNFNLCSSSKDDFLDICFVSNGVAVSKQENVILGVHLVSGKVLYEINTASYYPNVMPLDKSHFILLDESLAQVLRIDTGELINSLCTSKDGSKWRPNIMISLGNGDVLISSSDLVKKNTIFFLWHAESGRLKGTVSVCGEMPVALNHKACSNVIEVPLYDFRLLTLELSPFKLKMISGVSSAMEDSFHSFKPERSLQKTEQPERLNVDWLTRKNALILAFKNTNEIVNPQQCGMLSNTEFALRFTNQWRVYDFLSEEYEIYSDSLMELYHPKFIKNVLWQAALQNDFDSIVLYLAKAHKLSVKALSESISNFEKQVHYHSKLMLDSQERLLIASAEQFCIWQLNIETLDFEILVKNRPSAFINKELIIDTKGALQCWSDTGMKPLMCDQNQNPVLLPKEMHGTTSLNILLANNHFLYKKGLSFDVYNAIDGTKITELPGGHGHSQWGIRKLDNGPIVTWSRISMRSWDPKTYEALVEIQDPQDWGPGSEIVLSQNGKIVYQLGCWNTDRRVVVWDGKYNINVYGGHHKMLKAAQMLNEKFLISISERDNENNVELHVWPTSGFIVEH